MTKALNHKFWISIAWYKILYSKRFDIIFIQTNLWKN